MLGAPKWLSRPKTVQRPEPGWCTAPEAEGGKCTARRSQLAAAMLDTERTKTNGTPKPRGSAARGTEAQAGPAEGAWRGSRPIEDPEKMKKWGFVTAKPSEYLIHVRRGRVIERSSGQGASCFKWPWDAVAIIPTSLQRLCFRADQVTSEKVGVEVVGLAVYRIAEPRLAYRVLNFSYPERAQEKLEETLTGMFVGSARRLIANLTVEECLQKRKSALAEELIREIEPVVGGSGRPDDFTTQGWGVVIDTIEIQEVRILSERVFASLQAPYRTAIEQRAKEAKVRSEMEVAAREAEQALRAVQLESERERARAEAKQSLEERRIAQQLALRKQEMDAERAEAEAEAQNTVRRAELSAIEAQATIEQQEIEARRRRLEAEVSRERAALEAELKQIEAEARRITGQIELELDQKKAEIDRLRAEARARLLLAEKLPELAAGIGKRIENVRITQVGGDDPFSGLLRGVTSVIDTARELGR